MASVSSNFIGYVHRLFFIGTAPFKTKVRIWHGLPHCYSTHEFLSKQTYHVLLSKWIWVKKAIVPVGWILTEIWGDAWVHKKAALLQKTPFLNTQAMNKAEPPGVAAWKGVEHFSLEVRIDAVVTLTWMANGTDFPTSTIAKIANASFLWNLPSKKVGCG